ncbi:MAG: hypothetical protein V4719_22985 [Planctomycetota bacterium]
MPGEHLIRIDFDLGMMADKPSQPFKIPKRYSTESQLTHEVIQGSNHLELELFPDASDVKKTKTERSQG